MKRVGSRYLRLRPWTVYISLLLAAAARLWLASSQTPYRCSSTLHNRHSTALAQLLRVAIPTAAAAAAAAGPPGRTTDYVPGNGVYQASIHDCKIPAGFGVFSAEAANPWYSTNPTADMRADKCPVGFFGVGDTAAGIPTHNPACQKCPPEA
jgi:hypothetical protein